MPWIVLTLLFGAPPAMPPSPRAEQDLAARCEVARAVIAGQLEGRERPVIIVSNSGFGSRRVGVTDFMQGWLRGALPQRALAETFLAAPSLDLLTACPELPRGLARDGVAFGTDEVDAMTERSGTPPGGILTMLYPEDILAFSLPVLSADGQSALMHASTTCGPLCGSGFVLHLRRDAHGVWTSGSRRESWIS